MGQKRIKLNETEEEKKAKLVKTTEGQEKAVKDKKKKTKNQGKVAKKSPHSKSYQEALKLVDRNKNYPKKEAIVLLKKISLSKFDGSVEVTAMVKKTGLKGEVKFPYLAGKSKVIEIVSEKVIKDLENGQVNFDILIASPETMPKIVKFAKLLGPKGLMPNPKHKTVVADPEKRAKEMASKSQFKTEAKQPIIHQIIGKVSQKETELEANLNALIEAIGLNNLIKMVISPSIGPGIKINLEEKGE